MEKMKYKMASRTTLLLGRESVSRVDGAMIELIKNTYDADATFCYIYFDAKSDRILILDNGTGMTKSVISSYWMMIGTDNKRTDYFSSKKRIKSGEKGIGRFALDRLGSQCTMYTKSEKENLIYWKTDWSNFEAPGRTLDEIDADFDYIDGDITNHIPLFVLANIERIASETNRSFNLTTGTLLEISGLRDKWTESEFNRVVSAFGYLIPPGEQDSFTIIVQNSMDSNGYELSNEISNDFDYRIKANFDGNIFRINIIRNELDLKILPSDIFRHTRFSEFPYRYDDFTKEYFMKEYTITELLHNSAPEFIDIANRVGSFSFVYSFIKASVRDDGRGVNYYKTVSPKRRKWLSEYAGIKIYRDNFVVRPYGDKSSNSYDWLHLDARKGINPVAVSDKSENWHVNNSQGQGTVFISRITNEAILDKSSREGIIDNEYFSVFCDMLREIISVFEKDRAYIARTIRLYTEDQDEREKAKKEAKDIADSLLKSKEERNTHSKDKANESYNDSAKDDSVKLAKAVQYYEEEVEELISEIRLLRALATNGLITTSMLHDLKSINAMLVSRVETLKIAIKSNNEWLINRHLRDLTINDEFLKSWITVITTQSNRDKRSRQLKNLFSVIKSSIDLLKPILDRKKVNIDLTSDENTFERRIFELDFDSIIYNLIVNSIESFEHSNCHERKICIHTESTDSNFIIHYHDNGAGLSEAFISNPYEIFNYGITSKFDIDGTQIGTGLGMYIVASTISEYNGLYTLTEFNNGFGLDIIIPRG